MKLEVQVTNLELSKRLKELGVKQESSFYWHRSIPVDLNDWALVRVNAGGVAMEYISAFTVAELGEMLPERYFTQKWDCKWSGYQEISEGKKALLPVCFESFTSDTEADARARMLIYLIEQGLVKP